MTPKEQAAMQQALEALEACVEKFYAMKSTGVIGALPMQAVKAAQAITALREALAEQAEQEPVAWLWVSGHGSERLEWEPVEDTSKWKSTPLYAAPQPVQQEQVCIDWDTKTDEPIMGYTALVRTKDLTDEEELELARR